MPKSQSHYGTHWVHLTLRLIGLCLIIELRFAGKSGTLGDSIVCTPELQRHWILDVTVDPAPVVVDDHSGPTVRVGLCF